MLISLLAHVVNFSFIYLFICYYLLKLLCKLLQANYKISYHSRIFAMVLQFAFLSIRLAVYSKEKKLGKWKPHPLNTDFEFYYYYSKLDNYANNGRL